MAKSKITKAHVARRKVLELLDRLTSPSAMSKQEALEAMDELYADLEGRCEALANEIKEENQQ